MASSIPPADAPAKVPFEDLPLAERVKFAESFNPFQGIAPGWFIDAKDTIDNWCVATVLKVDSGEIQVGYDGWSSKYDFSFKLKSTKIAPFRMFSKGYTGQIRVPIRKLEFSVPLLLDNMKQINEVLSSGFRSLTTALSVTQYLRGQLYTFTDLLMTSNEYKPEELSMVYEFLALVTKLIAAWLELFPGLTKSFIEYQMCPKLMLVDRNVALAAAGYEMMDMLGWMFCLCPRTGLFFLRYDTEVNPAIAEYTIPLPETQPKFVEAREKYPIYDTLKDRICSDKDLVYGLFINLFNTFATAHGLTSLLEITSLEKAASRAVIAGYPNYRPPLDLIATFLAPFRTIKSVAKPEVCKEIATAGRTAFFQRVQLLDDKDVKDLNKEVINNAMSLMKGFLKLTLSTEEAEKTVQTHEMLISLKFLQSPSLEKRLNGIAEIRKMTEVVESGIIGKEGWFNSDYLVKWLVQHNILAKVFDDSTHPELIKRSAPILGFLAKKSAITPALLETVWKSQLDKHEDIVRAVYDSLKEIIEFLPSELTQLIYEKVNSLPAEKIDEKMLSFMKDFCVKAFLAQSKTPEKVHAEPMSDSGELPDAIREKGAVVVPDDVGLYFVKRFWSILQDDCGTVTQGVYDQALACFKETILNEMCAKYRAQYVHLCVENVKAHRTVTPSLALVIYLLAVMNAQKKLHKGGVSQWIKKLAKEYPLVEIMIESCQVYEKLVAETVKKSKVENMGELAVNGKMKHSYNLEMRFKFLEYVVRFGAEEVKMGKHNLMKLWNLYVEEPAADYDTKQFLKWISSDRDTPVPVAILPAEETQCIFDILCRSRSKLANTLGVHYHKCFANNFKLINVNSGSIEMKKGKLRVTRFAAILGLDQAWECLCYCTDEISRAGFSGLLIDVYTSLSDGIQDKRTEVMQTFIDRCIRSIVKAETDKEDLAITNLVKLLTTLFDSQDGKRFEDHEEPVHKFPITVTMRPAIDTKSIEAGIDVTVGQIRKKVADAFHIPFNGFQMYTPVKAFDPDDDDSKLRNVGWAHQIYIQKTESACENPKMYLAHNQTYIHSLFALLSKEHTPYVDSVWNLITTLPPNKKIQSDIESMNIGETAEGWNSLLDSKSVHKLLYSLQIVDGLLSRPESEADGKKKWISQFCQKEGLSHLFTALLSLPITDLHSPLPRKCFALLFKVISQIQSSGYPLRANVKPYDSCKEKMGDRILTVLDAFAEHSVFNEAQKMVLKTPKKIKVEGKIASIPTKKEQEDESAAFEHGFALLKDTKGDQEAFEYIVKYPNFKDFLVKGLVLSDNPFIQRALGDEIIGIYKSFRGVEYGPNHAHVVLIPYMIQSMVYETLEREVNCDRFYKLLNAMIKDLSKKDLVKLPIGFAEEIKAVANYIKQRKVVETKSTDTDYVLIGLMGLLEVLVGKFPEEKEYIGQECGITKEVLEDCLFEFPKSGNRNKTTAYLPPKCKSQAARQAAFSLLSTLCTDAPKNLTQVLSYLTPIHSNAAWRTKRIADWNIAPEAGDKSVTGYVGLKNLGCICYMNSLLQQFYMIPSFRNDVLSTVDPKGGANPDDNVLFQIQCLFSALTESVKQYYNPKIFCHALKDWEGKSINVLEQMDVDEFFNLFLDRLETAIKGTPQADTIKKHFGGVFANQLLCKDCPHSSVREEPFLALNLQVKNKKSLQQCLESFVEGEMLQGGNAYHCEKCDKKVTTLKRTCIKKLPRHLICVLKRFDINYDTMQKFKINEYCEFPMRIDMEGFTEEGLERKDLEREREKAKKEGRDADEIKPKRKLKKYPKEYYEYKLTGVVIHIGTADAGHYYSLAMDQEKRNVPEKDRWYEFNDTAVDNYNPDEIKDDAFGGEERLGGVEGWKTLGKIRNAYLLFYERATPYDPPEDDEDESPPTKEAAKGKVVPTGETVIPEPIYKAIVAENTKYWYNKFMFHDDYFDFALKLGLTWNSVENIMEKYPSKNMDYHLLGIKEDTMKAHAFQSPLISNALAKAEPLEKPLSAAELERLSEAVGKHVITLLLTTLVRSKTKTAVPDFIDLSKAYINKHPRVAQWILWQFCNSRIISEFLLEPAEAEMRRAAVGILYCSMLKAFEVEKSLLLTDPANTHLGKFAIAWFHQLPGCRKYTIHFEQFFQVISRLAFLGPEMRAALHRMGAVRRLLGFWASTPESKWNEFADLPLPENPEPELGLPSAVDERFQSPFEELFAAKREKMYQEAEPSFTFLLEALSWLIRGSGVDEKTGGSPFALAGADGCMIFKDPVVKEMLMAPKTIQGLIHECRTGLANSEMAKAMIHIAWENVEVKAAILRGIAEGVAQSEWDGVRRLFYFFREMMKYQDSTKEATVDIAQKELMDGMEKGKAGYYATFYAIKFIICLVQEVPALAGWYQAHPEKWSWILTWLESNPYPSFEHKETRPFKSREQNITALARGAGTISAEEQSNWGSIIGGYVKQLTALKNGAKIELQEEIGNQESLYYEKFMKNQIVEYSDSRTQTWERTVVKRVLDEMVYLQPEYLPEKYAEWVEVEAGNIAKAGTHTKGPAVAAAEESKDLYSSDDSPLGDDFESK